jgi:hypothetical protein
MEGRWQTSTDGLSLFSPEKPEFWTFICNELTNKKFLSRAKIKSCYHPNLTSLQALA